MKFNIDGTTKDGLPLSVAGTFLLVEFSEVDAKGLSSKRIDMVGPHDAVDVSEYWDTYQILGGGEIVWKKDGTPIR